MNPFDGIEQVFAADQEPVRYDFTLYGRECFVELRPMDADAFARYESKGSTITVDTTKRTVESAKVDVDSAAAEMELLLGTVVDFDLARKRTSRSGELVIEMTGPGKVFGRPRREELFKSLGREFRQRLVRVALEVNGLGPFVAVNSEDGTPE